MPSAAAATCGKIILLPLRHNLTSAYRSKYSVAVNTRAVRFIVYYKSSFSPDYWRIHWWGDAVHILELIVR